jgi:hypothetical protein
VLRNVKLLQEQPDTRNNESESHQGQACANPCKQGPFWSKMVTESDPCAVAAEASIFRPPEVSLSSFHTLCRVNETHSEA